MHSRAAVDLPRTTSSAIALHHRQNRRRHDGGPGPLNLELALDSSPKAAILLYAKSLPAVVFGFLMTRGGAAR